VCRRLTALALLAGVLGMQVPAARADESAAEPAEAQVPASVQEIGVRTGIAAGGRVTPGGLYLGGVYLYQLSDRDWFDGGLAFTFGSGAAACFRDREDRFLCDHGLVHGFSGEASAGVRRWMRSQGRFVPYVRAGISLGVAVFNRDEVRGLTLPAWIGGGIRARVSDGVYVAGGAMLKAGVGWFNKELGLEPLAALLMTAGVDFGLD
jgi:hypothetical protein